MSSRSQRSIAQPRNYKEFSETGHHNLPQGPEVDQHTLMHENNSDETRNSSSAGESSEIYTEHESEYEHGEVSSIRSNDEMNKSTRDHHRNRRSEAEYSASSENSSSDSEVLIGKMPRLTLKHDKHDKGKNGEKQCSNTGSVYVGHSTGARLKNKQYSAQHAYEHGHDQQRDGIHTRQRLQPESSSQLKRDPLIFSANMPTIPTPKLRRGRKQGGSTDVLELIVDKNEDNLDADMVQGGSPTKKRKVTSKSAVKNNKLGNKIAAVNINSNNTPAKKTPRKKTTVAARLTQQSNSPLENVASNTPILACNIAQHELNDSDSDAVDDATKKVNAAKQMLYHAQREADRAKKLREVEETKRKALAIQKQTERDMKKAQLDRSRYEKATAKNKSNTDKTDPASWSTVTQLSNTSNASRVHEPITKQLRENKKYRELNPLRRTRRLLVDHQGSNDPNIIGQDDGHIAWMDAELSGQELDKEIKHNTIYANRNSDNNNHFFGTDEAPMRGPPPLPDIALDISYQDAVNIANQLINEDNLSLCRTTGIMRHKDDNEHRIRSGRPTNLEAIYIQCRN